MVSYSEDPTTYHREYYRKRRQKLYDYLGGVCIVCGTDQDLQFDHIDPSNKSFDIKSNLTLNSIKDELDKCQLLCRTHHEDKTGSENSGFTHGTIYGFMRKKCSCTECTEAKRSWNELRRSKRQKTGTDGRGTYGQPSTHGEVRHYRRGCRCDECRAANARAARQLRLKKNLEVPGRS